MSALLDRLATRSDCEGRVGEIKRLDACPTLIYGAGIYAREVADFLEHLQVGVAAYVVDDPYVDRPRQDGIRPISFEGANASFEKFNVVIGFCGDPYRSAEDLKARDIRKINSIEIIDCRFWRRFEPLSRSHIETHQAAFQAAYDCLADDLSKTILAGFINAKLLYDPRPLRRFYSMRHYFPEDLPAFRPSEKDIFIDGGAFTGDTLARTVSMTGGRGCAMYYAFEPDGRNAARMLDYVRMNEIRSVEIIQKGLWNRSGRLRFQNGGDPRSFVGEEGNIEIEADTIDRLDVAATFIKMDIEGSEYEALRGAERTIRSHAPKLAIAVYHKPADLTDIPAYIKMLRPDYELYLRIHSLFSEELVIYAVAPY